MQTRQVFFKPGFTGLTASKPGYTGFIMIMSVRRAASSYCRPTVSGHLCCTCGLVTDIAQVVSAKLLGVTFSHNLKFDEHVKNILTLCNQRSYLLKCLKGQWIPSKELYTVFYAMIASRILYALPFGAVF